MKFTVDVSQWTEDGTGADPERPFRRQLERLAWLLSLEHDYHAAEDGYDPDNDRAVLTALFKRWGGPAAAELLDDRFDFDERWKQ